VCASQGRQTPELVARGPQAPPTRTRSAELRLAAEPAGSPDPAALTDRHNRPAAAFPLAGAQPKQVDLQPTEWVELSAGVAHIGFLAMAAQSVTRMPRLTPGQDR
jgi:hypothetical protein